VKRLSDAGHANTQLVVHSTPSRLIVTRKLLSNFPIQLRNCIHRSLLRKQGEAPRILVSNCVLKGEELEATYGRPLDLASHRTETAG
jgi:hypothetical protein